MVCGAKHEQCPLPCSFRVLHCVSKWPRLCFAWLCYAKLFYIDQSTIDAVVLQGWLWSHVSCRGCMLRKKSGKEKVVEGCRRSCEMKAFHLMMLLQQEAKLSMQDGLIEQVQLCFPCTVVSASCHCPGNKLRLLSVCLSSLKLWSKRALICAALCSHCCNWWFTHDKQHSTHLVCLSDCQRLV